jgi:hypothetical protein
MAGVEIGPNGWDYSCNRYFRFFDHHFRMEMGVVFVDVSSLPPPPPAAAAAASSSNGERRGVRRGSPPSSSAGSVGSAPGAGAGAGAGNSGRDQVQQEPLTSTPSTNRRLSDAELDHVMRRMPGAASAGTTSRIRRPAAGLAGRRLSRSAAQQHNQQNEFPPDLRRDLAAVINERDSLLYERDELLRKQDEMQEQLRRSESLREAVREEVADALHLERCALQREREDLMLELRKDMEEWSRKQQAHLDLQEGLREELRNVKLALENERQARLLLLVNAYMMNQQQQQQQQQQPSGSGPSGGGDTSPCEQQSAKVEVVCRTDMSSARRPWH